MAGSIFYDQRLNVVRAALTGEPDPSDFAALVEKLVSSPDFSPDVDVVYDLRQLRFSEVSLDFFREIAGIFEPYDQLRGHAAVALVVGHETHVTLTKVFKAMADRMFQQDIAIFTSMTAAENWILSQRGVTGSK